MHKIMNQKTKNYILEFCAYQEEPLHILMGALLEEGLYTDAKQFSNLFLQLLRDRYIEIEMPPEKGFKWVKVKEFTEKDLIDYIIEHEKEQFNEYPEKEYYVQTTEAGRALVKDDDVT